MALLVVVPCLNEEAHLPGLLAWLGADSAAARVVVVDGGSSDASVQIVREAAARNPRIALLDNPNRIQSAAVNLAVRAFGDECDSFVRVDAHAAYPTDFLARLAAAKAETGADTVTVSMRAVAAPGACFQRAAACAQNSVLGAGGSPHRKAGERRWTDHGHHALFDTAAYRAVGGYDETISHNEDAELDARLVANGARILLAADIVIDYFPRRTATALARQYFKYGEGRARTTLRHGHRPKLRQLAPIMVAPALAAALAVGPFISVAAIPAALWMSVCLVGGVILGLREKDPCACAAGVAAMVMHAAWSAGFLSHVLFGQTKTRTNPLTA